MTTPEEILSFWLDEVGPDGWYKQDEALDAEIRTRFEDAWHGAMQGRHALWLTYPSGTLAYVILMDQFPRNMFRGTEKASGRYVAANKVRTAGNVHKRHFPARPVAGKTERRRHGF